MPTISRFFGIVIQMYFKDHVPPHFHARYAGFRATIRIDPLGVIRGELPPRALGLVMEWARLNRDALLADWELASLFRPLDRIPPLE